MITKNKFYLKMIFTACICAIILTGCGSKYTVEEKSLVENQKENQETLENGVNRTSMEKSMEFSDESTEKIPEIVEVDWSEYFNGLNGTAVIYDASNKKYTFICLLPEHLEGDYWTAVELGIHEAIATYSDFNTSVKINYYDPYDYHSFVNASEAILALQPDGVMMAPTAPQYTKGFTDRLQASDIPYIYIDSNIKNVPPLAFFGQNSRQSGYFAARMMMLLARDEKEIVIFRKIHEGIVGSNQQENREIGFRQYMEEHHPSYNILELDLHAERNDEDNEMLDEFFRSHPTVKNGITFNSKVYIIGEYLQSHGKKDFNLIGYDLLDRNVACLKEGSVFFLIAQQPELQGANGIKALCDHLIFKKEVTCINYMPIDLLTVETIDYYHNK